MPRPTVYDDTQHMSPLLFDSETDDESTNRYIYPNQAHAKLAEPSPAAKVPSNEQIFQIFASLNEISNRLETTAKSTRTKVSGPTVRHRSFSAPLLYNTPTTDYTIDDDTPVKDAATLKPDEQVTPRVTRRSKFQRALRPKAKLCKLDINIVSSMPKLGTSKQSGKMVASKPNDFESAAMHSGSFSEGQQFRITTDNETESEETTLSQSISLFNSTGIRQYSFGLQCRSVSSTPEVQIISQAPPSIVTLSSESMTLDVKKSKKSKQADGNFAKEMLRLSPDIFGDFEKKSEETCCSVIVRPKVGHTSTPLSTDVMAIESDDELSRDMFSDCSVSLFVEFDFCRLIV